MFLSGSPLMGAVPMMARSLGLCLKTILAPALSLKLAIAAREVAGLNCCSSKRRGARAFNFQGEGGEDPEVSRCFHHGCLPALFRIHPPPIPPSLPAPQPLGWMGLEELPWDSSTTHTQSVECKKLNLLVSFSPSLGSEATSFFLRFRQTTSFRFQDSVVIVI